MKPRPHPRSLVAAACVFMAALTTPLVWHVLHSFHTSQTITEAYMAGEELRDAIYHANAELILDARSNVLGDGTADASRRGQTAATLRRLVGQARELRPGCGRSCWLTRADSLQGELRTAEAAAIRLADTGRRDEAVALLTSPGYASIHESFHEALDLYAAGIKAGVQTALGEERAEELRMLAVSGGILAVSVAVWIVLLRVIERWRLGLLREARERQEVEDRLATALRRFRRLFQHAHDAIYLVSEADGRIIDANRAAREQTGYTQRQLRTMRFGDLDAAPGERRLWPPARGTGGLTERRQRRRDGTAFPVELGVQRIEEPAGPMLLCVVRDVTARKALESHLGKAQKMECVGRLAAGIAHDFGNILLAISGFAMVGRRQLPTAHPAAEALTHIETAAAQATGVARSLLHFAHRPVGQVRPLELRSLVRSTLNLLDPSLPGAIDLDDSRVDGEPVWVEGDPYRLQQALLNLCLNARDAQPEGGRIALSVTGRGTRSGSTARIAVSDSGPGIPAEVRRRLGEPFFTTRSEDGGCGLGLFNVRTIMAECGGRLEIDSAPGVGSTFSLVLPLRAAPAARPSLRAVPELPSAARVLLVCGGEVVRNLAADALRTQGFSVAAAADAGDAAYRLADRDTCEVAVIDGDLPDGAAAECVDLLLQSAPEAALIVVQGACPLPPAAESRGIVLAKPYTMPELCEAVTAAAARQARRAEGRA